MRTHVEFRSNKFPAYEGEEEQVNPNLWGKRLAEYLSQKLMDKGLKIEKIHPEDWGWVIKISYDKFPLWIGCGHYEEYPDGYLVFVEPSKPFIRKGLFKKIDISEDIDKIAQTINNILESDPDIHDIKWWSEGEGK